ncbi:hypothetical protein ACKAV7_003786 [Fusarium commune]
MYSVEQLTTDGNSRAHVGNNYTTNNYNYPETSRNQCIADLRPTDPRDDKARIEKTKGGLLRDSYLWILDNTDFQLFRDDPQRRLLWIKGDPGKGKTMLLCGIINELEKETANLVCYFFCQGTDSRINNATAVLRGLIYLLIDQQPSLMPHVRKRYDRAGKGLFEDANAWWALSDILVNILQDPNLTSAFLIIDALDECETGLSMLLDLIVQHSSSARLKWLISSRNKAEIEQKLRVDTSRARLSLELKHNAECVSQAVDTYIRHSVSQMPKIQDDQGLQDELCAVIQQKANQTFLWVSLVIKELNDMESWEVLQTVDKIPSGLKKVYGRMTRNIQQLRPGCLELCRPLLSTVCTAYRPLSLHELGILSGLPIEISRKPQSVKRIVAMCGSFLTIRDDSVYIVHQSAKEYLATEACRVIFPAGDGKVHYFTFLRSLQIMSETLRRDMYDLHHPGTSIDDVSQPEPDPLASARYSCIYWVDHLSDAISRKTTIPIEDVRDNGRVHQFLRKNYLYWLEALSLSRGMPEGVVAMTKLEILLEGHDGLYLVELVRDARRFILHNRWIIENAPLQAYTSALIFSPARSLIRKLYEDEEPKWITKKPTVEWHWGPCIQTLEGHADGVEAVAFSPGSHFLASATKKTVSLWDIPTGALRSTIDCFRGEAWSQVSLVFSPDSQLLACASTWDNMAKLLDVKTGALSFTLEGHSGKINAIACSPSGELIATVSDDKTARLWYLRTGVSLCSLEGHSERVTAIDFSSNHELVATGSYDKTIKLWNIGKELTHRTLRHLGGIKALQFSPDSRLLASGDYYGVVTLWHTSMASLFLTLKGHSEYVKAVEFSSDGRLLASGSGGGTVIIWDTMTGMLQCTLDKHWSEASALAFSPTSQVLATAASRDRVARLWNPSTGKVLSFLEGHSMGANALAFSPNGHILASASSDGTVKLWDTSLQSPSHVFEGHSDAIMTARFSPDSRTLVSASWDGTGMLWDTATGDLVEVLEGHSDEVMAAVFSPDGQLIATASSDRTIKLWDASKGAWRCTLDGHTKGVHAITFSPDGKFLASASDEELYIWDVRAGELCGTLEGHSSWIDAVTFSQEGCFLASASGDKTAKVWNVMIGTLHCTLEGLPDHVRALAFSSDNCTLALASQDSLIQLWDLAGRCQVQVIHCGDVHYRLSFSPDDSHLITDRGLLHRDTTSSSADLRSADMACQLFVRKNWVSWKGIDVLWIPPAYRGEMVALEHNIVALAHSSGRFSFLELQPPEIMGDHKCEATK